MLILGLGTNLGNRKENLTKATSLIALHLLDNIVVSSVYETAPLLPPEPESGWEEKNFLNIAVGGKLKIEATPEELLQIVKEMEHQLGRTPSSRWAPRIIDIDILELDGLIYSSPALTIPHIGLTERDFAIKPFTDIAPDWKHPQTNISAAEYAAKFKLEPLCSF